MNTIDVIINDRVITIKELSIKETKDIYYYAKDKSYIESIFFCFEKIVVNQEVLDNIGLDDMIEILSKYKLFLNKTIEFAKFLGFDLENLKKKAMIEEQKKKQKKIL